MKGSGARPINDRAALLPDRAALLGGRNGMMRAMADRGFSRQLGAAFDPRQRIQRDPFNELVVFIVSAVGASVVVPVILLIVGAFTGEFAFLIFVGSSIVLELLLIGTLRPAMKPREQAGWMLLWGFTAAVLGAAFWELVFAPVLS